MSSPSPYPTYYNGLKGESEPEAETGNPPYHADKEGAGWLLDPIETMRWRADRRWRSLVAVLVFLDGHGSPLPLVSGGHWCSRGGVRRWRECHR